MKLADIRPGWQTDFILHRLDARIIERPDCLVVRTPSNPAFYWGNCLILPRLPADDELPHWLARFDAEITGPQPASRHVAIGADVDFHGQSLPRWEAAGFTLQVETMMRLVPGGERPAARAPRGRTELKLLTLPADAAAIVEVEMTDAGGFEPTGYRAYLQRQHERYARLQAQDRLRWFGLFCDGTLAASCGLLRDGGTGRFQRVVTHAGWRRRGLATALVHGVLRWAFDVWQLRELYMAAVPTDVAIGIYRSLGFAECSSGIGLQRNAPEDQAGA